MCDWWKCHYLLYYKWEITKSCTLSGSRNLSWYLSKYYTYFFTKFYYINFLTFYFITIKKKINCSHFHIAVLLSQYIPRKMFIYCFLKNLQPENSESLWKLYHSYLRLFHQIMVRPSVDYFHHLKHLGYYLFCKPIFFNLATM